MQAVARAPLVLATFLIFVSSVSFLFSEGQEPRRTVWDGIYSEQQAARGRELYKQSCGHCHRDDLTGGGSEVGAPPLRGPIFFYRWLHQPDAEMFLTIGATMPQNKPDSLTPQTVAFCSRKTGCRQVRRSCRQTWTRSGRFS
jgi:hypothetical protein